MPTIFCDDRPQAEAQFEELTRRQALGGEFFMTTGQFLMTEQGEFEIRKATGVVFSPVPLPGSEEYCGAPKFHGVIVELGAQVDFEPKWKDSYIPGY